MTLPLKLDFLAPIPVGHKVQVIYGQLWATPLFGGPPRWEDMLEPIVVDLDTGIVYCSPYAADLLVPSPLGFKPGTNHRASSVVEGRVTSCMMSSSGGDSASLVTDLVVEPIPQGYRQ